VKKHLGWLPVLLGGSSALLFLCTLFPGVGGVVNRGDSAKFQFLGVVHGVGHPPGNPLYLALLELVQAIPLGTPAGRANVTSALCAGVAVGLLSDAARRLAGLWSSLIAALALSLGGLFWTFATEAEVYALGAVFVAWVLQALSRAECERDGARVSEALAAFALGLSNHLSLLLAGPALLVACARFWGLGVRPSGRQLLLPAAASLVTLALYAAIPWSASQGWLTYSEYGDPGSFEAFVDFVSAKKFRGSFSFPGLDEKLLERATYVLELLSRQWSLALWALVLPSLWLLHRRSSAMTWFAVLSVGAWLAFAFVYAIPDPDGFFVPVVVVCSLALAVAAATAPPRQLWSALVILALLPSAATHLAHYRDTVAYDVLEDVGQTPARELLDLPDLVGRLPVGALLALPCGHYGCLQVSNYYRFADQRMRERHIELVTIQGGVGYNMPAKPRSISPAVGKHQVVCTIQARERGLMARHGVTVRTEARGTRQIGDASQERIPLFCSVPQP
jgi:hypothetical protein